MLDPAQGRVALVCQIEQLPNPAFDFVMVQILWPHPCLVRRALVLVSSVHPSLERLYMPANEVPGHSWPIQAISWEQRHQLSTCPASSGRSFQATLFSGIYPTSQNVALSGSS
jgi:hypothetical protein